MREEVNARTSGLGRAAALRLARRMRRVVAARGRRVQEFDMRADPPGDAALAKALLGPSGKLRAPSMVVGDTLVVGFTPDLYRTVIP